MPQPATANRPPAGSSYNSVCGFLIGQASSAGTDAAGAGRVPLNARLYSSYIRDRWTATDKLTIDFGTRWEYFPVPTRPDRGIEFYDVDTGNVLLCGVGSDPKGLRDQDAARRVSDRASEWPIALPTNGSPAPATA